MYISFGAGNEIPVYVFKILSKIEIVFLCRNRLGFSTEKLYTVSFSNNTSMYKIKPVFCVDL